MNHNKNEVKKVTYTPQAMVLLGWGQSSHALVEGNAVNSLYAIRYAGHAEDGKTQWYRADGTATTDMVYDAATDDIVCMGTLDPKCTMSINPSVSYAGFTLSAMLSYYGAHVMRADTNNWASSSWLAGVGAMTTAVRDYYAAPDNYTLPLPSVYNYFNSYNTGQSLYFFDQAVVPADYMKLRNIVLTYNFAPSFCHKLHIGSARIRLQANNICKWVKNDLGVDPEANNPWTGFDTLAPMRSYTMNLTVNF